MTDAPERICQICKRDVNFRADLRMVSGGGKFWHHPCYTVQQKLDMLTQRNEILVERTKDAEAQYIRRDIADAAVLAERERWARRALDNYEEFLSGSDISLAAHEENKTLTAAASFAAAAYEKGYGGQAVHALLRSFLIALIDTADERLDYLRADPEAGAAARKAISDINAIRARTKQEGK